MKKNIIYLTGFMGAGKSTIAPILANTLGWDYFDLDKMIEQRANRRISQIFETSGEPGFRKMEAEMLRELSAGENTIISLGGGTICYGDNLNVVKNNGILIYLKTTVESVYKRLAYKNDRPMINFNSEGISKSDALNRINDIYEARKPFYEQADFTVETENIPIGRTVDYLAKLIKTQLKGKKVEEN